MVVQNSNGQCLIWPGHIATVSLHNYDFIVQDSPRVGGSYIISVDAKFRIQSEFNDDATKARLTTMLISQRNQGITYPQVTLELIEQAKDAQPLPIHERADRLLRFMVRQAKTVGTPLDLRKDNPGFYAWSESTEDDEIGHFLDYLLKKGWIEKRAGVGDRKFGDYDIPDEVRVTVEGHSRIADLTVNADSSQAFVAMWFDDSMAKAYEVGIETGIKEAGYKPLRIDKKEHINKIDDEIIAEIRRSRFLIADFTQGSDGPRGGVYYEAGFAAGLGIPVIYTCKEDMVDKLHFDTRQYAHIVWSAPVDLREKLRNRILAVLGEGPERSHAG